MGKIKDAIMENEESKLEKINNNDTIKIITNNGNKYEVKVKNILQYDDKKLEYKIYLKNYQGDVDGWKIVSVNMQNVESITLYHKFYE